MNQLLRLSLLSLVPACALQLCSPLQAQIPAGASSPSAIPPVIEINYLDNPGGLEKLAKDIFKAQKENDGPRAGALLQSLLLPHPRDWYNDVFGSWAADHEGADYEAGGQKLPLELAQFFLQAYQDHMTDVSVVRFTDSCDDNAGEMAFGILHERLDPVPMYQLRLADGNRFRHLFPFVYVDGGFRLVLAPKLESFFSAPPRKLSSSTSPENPSNSENEKTHNSLAPRIRVGGNVIAARIIRKVVPEYPEKARKEHLEGTVRFHAIIGKDGAIRQLHVMKGYCSLADSALKAVSQWRYQPTLFNGQPVEVDTTVDVIFALNK